MLIHQVTVRLLLWIVAVQSRASSAYLFILMYNYSFSGLCLKWTSEAFNVRFPSAWSVHLEYKVVMPLEAWFCLHILSHWGWDAGCPSASQACWCASETATWQVELEPLAQLATGSTLSLAVEQDMNHDLAHLLRHACFTYVSQLIEPK
jgi:hypothetical protein